MPHRAGPARLRQFRWLRWYLLRRAETAVAVTAFRYQRCIAHVMIARTAPEITPATAARVSLSGQLGPDGVFDINTPELQAGGSRPVSLDALSETA